MTVDVGEGLRSGTLARAAGVNQQTLRYYERRGLLTPATRTLGGHRLYSPDAVTVLRVIKAAQRLGFSLEEISELIEVGKHHHGKTDAGLQARASREAAGGRVADRGPAGDPRDPQRGDRCRVRRHRPVRRVGLLPAAIRSSRGTPDRAEGTLTMSATWKDRLLLGAGAGACVVCCAAPLLAFLGIAGAAATIGTFVFAGGAFRCGGGSGQPGGGVAAASCERLTACDPQAGPVDIVLGPTPSDTARR